MKIFTIVLVLLLSACASKEKVTTKTDGKTEKVSKPALPAKATVTSTGAPAPASIVCKSGSEERTIENRKTDAGGCEVHYTKFGQAQQIANAVNGAEYCDTVASKVKSNLEAAGWTCLEG